MKSIFTQTKPLKYFSSSFFISVGVINLVHSVFVLHEYFIRDFLILTFLSLPLIINKRIFFLVFGFLAALFSITIFFIHLFSFLDKNQFSVIMYISGFFIYGLSFCSGLGMIYIGTFSNQKNTFRLI